MRKRVMILTASIGCGHDQAAETLAKKFKEQGEGIETEIIDFMEMMNTSISHLIKSSYLKMIDLFPSWYHLLYQNTMKIKNNSKVKSIFIYRYEKKLLQLIEKRQPDLILFTNPFPLILVSDMKRKGIMNVDTATVITDYTAHSVWLDQTVNYYFVGSYSLMEDLVRKGIRKDSISVTGIPIRSEFYKYLDEKRILKEQGLSPALPTLLIMGGGLGLGPLDEIIQVLNKVKAPLQLLVVTGKNQELLESLRGQCRKSNHHVKLYGYYKNINELMTISDLLISKAGGITMSEAIQKELPILITHPIPGQEVGNAQHLSALGIAKHIEDLEDLATTVDDLLFKNPLHYQGMKAQLRGLRKQDAAGAIVKELVKNTFKNSDNVVNQPQNL